MLAGVIALSGVVEGYFQGRSLGKLLLGIRVQRTDGQPVTPEDVAECILFALTRPPHVNIDEIVVKALAQSSGARIHRAGQ